MIDTQGGGGVGDLLVVESQIAVLVLVAAIVDAHLVSLDKEMAQIALRHISFTTIAH